MWEFWCLLGGCFEGSLGVGLRFGMLLLEIRRLFWGWSLVWICLAWRAGY